MVRLHDLEEEEERLPWRRRLWTGAKLRLPIFILYTLGAMVGSVLLHGIRIWSDGRNAESYNAGFLAGLRGATESAALEIASGLSPANCYGPVAWEEAGDAFRVWPQVGREMRITAGGVCTTAALTVQLRDQAEWLSEHSPGEENQRLWSQYLTPLGPIDPIIDSELGPKHWP